MHFAREPREAVMEMNSGPQRQAARRRERCDFLKYARSRIAPSEVGLAVLRRRRLPGLRRDDVAALCGVSVAWYTWFETGRPNVRASPKLIAAIARALRLGAQETTYLFSLAIPEMPAMPAPALHEVEPMLASISSTWRRGRSAGEAALRACDFLPVGVYCTTPAGEILYANDALVGLLQYPSKASYMRLDVTRDLYDDAHERRVWQRDIERAGRLRNVGTKARRADGSRVDVRDTAVAIRADVGETACYLGIWITDFGPLPAERHVSL